MSKKTKNKRPAEMFAERLRMSNSDLKVILAMDQLRRKSRKKDYPMKKSLLLANSFIIFNSDRAYNVDSVFINALQDILLKFL